MSDGLAGDRRLDVHGLHHGGQDDRDEMAGVMAIRTGERTFEESIASS